MDKVWELVFVAFGFCCSGNVGKLVCADTDTGIASECISAALGFCCCNIGKLVTTDTGRISELFFAAFGFCRSGRVGKLASGNAGKILGCSSKASFANKDSELVSAALEVCCCNVGKPVSAEAVAFRFSRNSDMTNRMMFFWKSTEKSKIGTSKLQIQTPSTNFIGSISLWIKAPTVQLVTASLAARGVWIDDSADSHRSWFNLHYPLSLGCLEIVRICLNYCAYLAYLLRIVHQLAANTFLHPVGGFFNQNLGSSSHFSKKHLKKNWKFEDRQHQDRVFCLSDPSDPGEGSLVRPPETSHHPPPYSLVGTTSSAPESGSNPMGQADENVILETSAKGKGGTTNPLNRSKKYPKKVMVGYFDVYEKSFIRNVCVYAFSIHICSINTSVYMYCIF